MWNVRTDRLTVPDPPELMETLFELKVSLGLLGEQTAESDTIPVKPLTLAMLTVTVPEVPATRLRELTSVLTPKS